MEIVKKDITTFDDIRNLVDTFYSQVRRDELLGPVFSDTIKDNWSVHLEKMYSFWQTVLLNEYTYQGGPFPPHMKLNIVASHFQRWMQLFTQTVDLLFAGEKADEAKWRAGKMAELFQYKLNIHKSE